MKTKLQIIDETVRYYRTHSRGINSHTNCEYITEDGNMCAVGRCLTKKALDSILYDNPGDLYDLSDRFDNYIPFKQSYKGHEDEFWSTLQDFHDSRSNWEENSKGGNNLTEGGKNRLAFLKQIYGNK